MNKAVTVDPSDWVDRYGDYLFRFAMLRLRDRSRAEDLVQETFLAAFKDRGSFSGNSSEAAWLVGILKHKIADHFRHQAREAPLEDGDLREQPDPSPFDRSGHWAKGPTDWGSNPADLSPIRQADRCARPSPHVQVLREIRTTAPPDPRDRSAIRSHGGETRGSALGNPFGRGAGAYQEISPQPIIRPR